MRNLKLTLEASQEFIYDITKIEIILFLISSKNKFLVEILEKIVRFDRHNMKLKDKVTS